MGNTLIFKTNKMITFNYFLSSLCYQAFFLAFSSSLLFVVNGVYWDIIITTKKVKTEEHAEHEGLNVDDDFGLKYDDDDDVIELSNRRVSDDSDEEDDFYFDADGNRCIVQC